MGKGPALPLVFPYPLPPSGSRLQRRRSSSSGCSCLPYGLVLRTAFHTWGLHPPTARNMLVLPSWLHPLWLSVSGWAAPAFIWLRPGQGGRSSSPFSPCQTIVQSPQPLFSPVQTWSVAGLWVPSLGFLSLLRWASPFPPLKDSAPFPSSALTPGLPRSFLQMQAVRVPGACIRLKTCRSYL